MPMSLPAFIEEQLPFDRRDVTVDGVRMNVLEDGPEDADETLLFQHGNPTWSYLWRNLMLPARDEGHRVIAPDMVGLGLSEKPASPAYHALDRHVGNLVGLVERLDLDDLTLVLHDWGGPLGMGLATRQPDHIKRIVVANTVAFPPSRERSLSWWHEALSSSVGGYLGEKLNLVAQTALRFGVNDPLPRPVRNAYLYPMKDPNARMAARRLVEMVPDGPEHPSARTLARIQEGYKDLQDIPMLVLWADQDPVMRPVFTEKWKEAFPHADVRHVSQTAGHFWQEEDPGAFLRPILRFVEDGKEGKTSKKS